MAETGTNNEKGATRYRCFEILGENMFCVQNSDYFEYPINNETVNNYEDNDLFLELFIESAPEERTEVHSSLEKAIWAHEQDFQE